MAEEYIEGQQEPAVPQLSREDLEQMIREGVGAGLQQAVQQSLRQQPVQQQSSQPQQPDNPFREWIDPVVQPGLQQAHLRTMAMEDKVDFYSSDQWVRDVEDHLVGETDEERRKERAELRADIEQYFANFMQQGRPIIRKDLLDYTLGKRIREQSGKYQDAVHKRKSAVQQAELAKARRHVDMGGSAMDFDPRSVHAMPIEKVQEQYGDFQF